MSEKTFTGLYIDKGILDNITVNLEKSNSRTRNEFIVKAIRFYITHLNCKDNSDILTPALESVVSSKIQDTENRIARVLFKLSVEVAMMMNVVANSNRISFADLDDLRKLCVEEVSKINGKYRFEDAVKFQKS